VDLVIGPAKGDPREVKESGIPEVWKALRRSIEVEERERGRSSKL
jgi:hypothetical protein